MSVNVLRPFSVDVDNFINAKEIFSDKIVQRVWGAATANRPSRPWTRGNAFDKLTRTGRYRTEPSRDKIKEWILCRNSF